MALPAQWTDEEFLAFVDTLPDMKTKYLLVSYVVRLNPKIILHPAFAKWVKDNTINLVELEK